MGGVVAFFAASAVGLLFAGKKPTGPVDQNLVNQVNQLKAQVNQS